MSQLVSVIIPVYNTAPYLDACLSSVLGQSLREIEVICVDDKSTDDSLFIIRKYQAMDSRLKIIALPVNQGVSVARNRGLEEAVGDYVYFMDSDDFIDHFYLESMYEHAVDNNQDVVINTNWIIMDEAHSKEVPAANPGFDKKDPFFCSPFKVQAFFPRLVWTRLYRRRFLLDNEIKFPILKGKESGEDEFFVSLAEILHCKSYLFPGPWYYYRAYREGSYTYQKITFGHIESYYSLYKELIRRNIPIDSIKLFYAGHLRLDSAEKFSLFQSFMKEIEPHVNNNPKLYVPFDIYCMRAVLSSDSYESFIQKYNPDLSLSFVRDRLKKRSDRIG